MCLLPKPDFLPPAASVLILLHSGKVPAPPRSLLTRTCDNTAAPLHSERVGHNCFPMFRVDYIVSQLDPGSTGTADSRLSCALHHV